MKHSLRAALQQSICCLILATGPAQAMAADAALDDPAVVKQQLAAPVASVEKDKLTPQGAVRFLAGLAEINLYCDTAALRSAGYITDTEADKNVSIRFKDLSLSAAMDSLVKTMNKPASPLKWDVESGVVVLSTAADKTWKMMSQAASSYAKDETYNEDRIIESIGFDDLLLSEAIKRLRDDGINLHFRWSALKSIEVDPPTRVNVVLKRVRPRTVMQMLVRDLAGPEAKVGFMIRDGVWVISTPADLAKQSREWSLRPRQVKDQESANKLATVVDEFSFDGTGFGDVLENFARTNELAFDVDWTGLSAIGIDRSTPVSMNVHHVRASTAIDLLLAEVGGADHVLDYIVENGTVRVTVKKEPAVKPATRPAKKAKQSQK